MISTSSVFASTVSVLDPAGIVGDVAGVFTALPTGVCRRLEDLRDALNRIAGMLGVVR